MKARWFMVTKEPRFSKFREENYNSYNKKEDIHSIFHEDNPLTESEQKLSTLVKVIKIAEHFNTYFINVGPNLASSISAPSKEFTEFLPPPLTSSMFLMPTDVIEVKETISAMKDGKSAGHDQFSTKIIKLTIDELVEPLVYIINSSLTIGCVPDDMKVAKVIPIYKKDDNHYFSNYRPISLLSIFSKLLEKIMAKRLLSFLSKHNVLIPQQFGFRTAHSTELALAYLIHKLTKKMENKEFIIGVFLDLSKAFDTVDHTILLHKLELHGVRGNAYNWFNSFIVERKQYVHYQNISSGMQIITCGVPQGSVLGPILFTLYINDLVHASSALELLLFADDTNVFCSDKNLQHLTLKINTELQKLSIWFASNKLSLNISKTNYMIIKPYQRRIEFEHRIELCGHPIKRVSRVKFLGVLLSDSLSWEDHITSVRGKVARGVGVIGSVRHILPSSCLKLLYNSLVLPYFNYCLLNWGGAVQSHLYPLIVLQKKAIRILTNSDYLSHTAPLFKKLNILTLSQQYKLKLCLFMFKYNNQLLPTVFNNILIYNSDLHSHNTRGHTNFHLDFSRLVCSESSVRIQGPRLWDQLPEQITKLKSIVTFKRHLKYHIINYSDW